jgi:hypothetical protein
MNDQEPIPDTSTPPPAYHDWREQRRAERWARREARWQRPAGRPYGWIGGAIHLDPCLLGLCRRLGKLPK